MQRSSTIGVEKFIDTMVSHGAWSKKRRLRLHLDRMFEGIDLTEKTVLDIGGGNGLLSLYAAIVGAKQVMCLEPEASGSTVAIHDAFAKLSADLEVHNVSLRAIDFQSFDSEGVKWDVIILSNSINHLDEQACMTLRSSERSKMAYRDIFAKVRSVAATGAQIVISDCGRSNLFALLGITNPFVPSIEWEKHQNPIAWQRMLADVGFKNPKITWTSPNALGKRGRWLFGNRLASYFTFSHFRLSMELDA